MSICYQSSHRWRYCCRVLLWCLVLTGQVALAQIGISPQYYDIALEDGKKSHNFRLFNLGDADVEIQVSVANWSMDDSNRAQIVPSSPQSLDQWMIINPLRFTIPAGQSQAVRFAIRPALVLDEGEHRAMVYFDEVLPPDTAPGQANLRSRFRLGAAVYGQMGQVSRTAEFGGVELRQNNALIRLTNTGSANVRMKGHWSLWAADQFPGLDDEQVIHTQLKQAMPAGMLAAGVLPTTPVLPGDSRQIVMPLTNLEIDQVATSAVLVLKGTLGEGYLHEAIPVIVPGQTAEQ